MKTLLQLCKEIVKDSIDYDYLGDQTLKQVFTAEYGYKGINQKACENYLRGLPSVCTVPFTNHDILTLAAENGLSRKGVNAQYQLVEDYWEAIGYAFYQLISK